MKLRFSIRDLFWLALFVAMGIGWWTDHSRLAPKAALVNELQETTRQHAEAFSMLANKTNQQFHEQFMRYTQLAYQQFKQNSILEFALFRMRKYDPELVDAAMKENVELADLPERP